MAETHPNHRFSVAPMLDWTDRHYRYMARLMSQHALLYTEMVTTGAILYGKYDHLLYHEDEHPLALQLGGSNPQDLAKCAKIAQDRGFDEINFNVGCPSDRVQNGQFGACLMGEAQTVADCIAAMRDVVDIPVTVKTRIGIDDQDSYEFLVNFVETVKAAGCSSWIIHARKAWLSGLSPKQNRDIPPLDYPRVYQIKQDFPELTISINGGIQTFADMQAHLQHLDGVMVGRKAYQDPFMLAQVDTEIFQQPQRSLSRVDVVEKMIPYIQNHLDQGGRLNHITRHMIGLFQGISHGKAWRRHLSENATRPGADTRVVFDALEKFMRPSFDVPTA